MPINKVNSPVFVYNDSHLSFNLLYKEHVLCFYVCCFVCFDSLRLSQQFFSHHWDGSSWVEPVLSRGLSVLLKDTTQCLRWGSNPLTYVAYIHNLCYHGSKHYEPVVQRSAWIVYICFATNSDLPMTQFLPRVQPRGQSYSYQDCIISPWWMSLDPSHLWGCPGS